MPRMDLDHDACYRAVKQRDARFDGRFFTAVKTTGWPTTDPWGEGADEDSVIVVLSLLTVWVRAVEVLPVK